MFKCVKCKTKYNKKRKPTIGNTVRGDTEFKVPIITRKVTYLTQIKYLKSYLDGSEDSVEIKTVKTTNGFEIVKEDSYCKKHLPKIITPTIQDSIVRKRIVTTKRVVIKSKKRKRNKHGKTRRYN